MKFKRIIAFIIDVTIAGFLYNLFDSAFPQLIEANPVDMFGYNVEITYSLALVFDLLYFLLFDLINKGATLGRMIFGLVITSEDGSVSTSKLVTRTLLKMISIVFLFISGLVFLFSNSITLHDQLARTSVIARKR